MNLLGAASYDPAVAVSKATSSLLAMTALDTTNLRLAITVPAHGMVMFRLMCAITGATTLPTILLGVMNGVTVIARSTPQIFTGTQNATTQNAMAMVEIIATGLAAGAMNVDAAYAVQVLVASTNIKYGGPNTNAGANAWGAFVFEAWDPQPLKTGLGGGVNTTQWNGVNVAAPATAGIPDVNIKNINNVSTASVTTINANQGTTQPINFTGTAAAALTKSDMVDIAGAAVATGTAQIGVNVVNVNATAQTARDLGAQLDVAVSTRLAPTVAARTLDVTATGAAGIDWANVENPTTALALTGTTISSTQVAASVTGNVGGNVTGSVGSVVGAVGSVTAAVSVTGDLSATMKASVTTACTASTPTAAAVTGAVGSVTGLTAANLDVAVSSRLASASYTSPLTAATTRSALGLASANLDAQLATLDGDVLTRLPTSLYSAPDNVSIASIKAKTDSLGFTVPGKLDVNVLVVNGVTLKGAGTSASPWSPA